MGDQQRFGTEGLQLAHDLFTAWDAYQQDGDRARLQVQIAPLQGKLRAMLEQAARKSPRTKYHRLARISPPIGSVGQLTGMRRSPRDQPPVPAKQRRRGVTTNDRLLARGSSLLAAARRTRSAGLSSGRPT